MAWQKGSPVLYWPFVRHPDYPPKRGTVISDGVVKFGDTECVRIEKDNGGTDYIAITHIDHAPTD